MNNEPNNTNQEVESRVNVVGMNKGKRWFVVIIAVIVVGALYYFFFMGDKKTEVKQNEQVKEDDINKLIKESKPVTQESAPKIVLPSRLPDLPPLVAPQLPSAPPSENVPVLDNKSMSLEPPKLPAISDQPSLSPPGLPPQQHVATPAFSPPATTIASGYDKERRSTAMLVMSSDTNISDKEEWVVNDKGQKVLVKKNLVENYATLEHSSSPQVKAKKMSDMRFLVAQGKIIDAVLETAVNSDLDGELRAVVSRDVYADLGDLILIPKGSRLIGKYTYDHKAGNKRVNVIWSRLIIPNGVDLDISSPGVDELGRHGLGGKVDDKFGNVLTSTLLLTGISFGTAMLVSKIPGVKDEKMSILEDHIPKNAKDMIEKITPGTNRTVKTTTLPFNMLSQSVQDFSESMKNIVEKYKDDTPTVYVDQGTLVKVFVERDLIFPPEIVNNVKRIE